MQVPLLSQVLDQESQMSAVTKSKIKKMTLMDTWEVTVEAIDYMPMWMCRMDWWQYLQWAWIWGLTFILTTMFLLAADSNTASFSSSTEKILLLNSQHQVYVIPVPRNRLSKLKEKHHTRVLGSPVHCRSLPVKPCLAAGACVWVNNISRCCVAMAIGCSERTLAHICSNQ